LSSQQDVQSSLLRLRWLLAAAEVEKCAARIAHLLRAKYDPNQPRVPAGNPDGGRWTDDGITGGIELADDAGGDERAAAAAPSLEKILALAPRLAATRASMNRCIDLCYRLLERFQPPGSDRNEFDFRRCLNACLGR
jgi:hypothetical protein